MIENVEVPANKHWYESGVMLEADQTYKFSASGEWIDLTIHCGPDGYSLQEKIPDWQQPMFKLVEPLRSIDTGDRWFQLLGKVGESVFVIGSSLTFRAPESGELLCSPNDCPFMYWNNLGQLKLIVESVD